MIFLFLGIGFFASTLGAICGIGGGFIIKPLLDLTRAVPLDAVSFMSSAAVLAMSTYSVTKHLLAKGNQLDLVTVIPLSMGAIAGGGMGERLRAFAFAAASPGAASVIQSILLAVMTVGTLLYMLKRDDLHRRDCNAMSVKALAGVALGCVSSFIGIGGGPINLVVLHYLFSMDGKTAAINSLFIIALSQLTNVSLSIALDPPTGDILLIVAMALGGLAGGWVGQRIYRHISERALHKLVFLVQCFILALCVFNILALCGETA